MKPTSGAFPALFRNTLIAIAASAVMASCTAETVDPTNPWAPGVDYSSKAEDGLQVGHRLMAAQQYELALEAFTRAALDHGMTGEVLSSLGTANLGLGRLGQAETLLRRAVKAEPDWPEAMNNLGVVLMEQGNYAEAEQVLRRAYALDNGESDPIRENLLLALANLDNSAINAGQNQDYELVQRGRGNILIRQTP
ncbi:tetratricopeptide repeat protein [Parasedimentitalea psychrophila]|uniref:Tetratricopeptide repeat protein n=1 Tax=Parasedimentitalea psychrophila TaxID=2997337 RepID=A0A9Y2L089_9RHOB|nr:tetratricopeptide repeat protein [Parasedimentitalea psychrophila]WIY25933.1 tetratricopeptide repeat protein [Parasedimentitalea psychrophila]